MFRTGRVLRIVGLLLLIAPTWTDAQDKKLAITDLSQVDEDFRFQGEFSGAALSPQGCCQAVGLQVAARGNARFDGIYYVGGLPGGGWDHQPYTPVRGEREGEQLILHGEGVLITVEPHQAAVFHPTTGRPLGQLVRANRISATFNAPPPYGARVLFNGSGTEHWKNGKISPEGHLDIGAETVEPVGDFFLHAEFRTPYMPYATGQGRGNSGFYLQRRYEVQVLDSFAQLPANNEAGSLYKTKAPEYNMSFPPLSWQTYDICFTAARFDASGQKIANARITVRHNGITIHDNFELPNKTGNGKPEGPEPLPILLQNHGNPVQFRNIWLVDLTPRYAVPAASYSHTWSLQPAQSAGTGSLVFTGTADGINRDRVFGRNRDRHAGFAIR